MALRHPLIFAYNVQARIHQVFRFRLVEHIKQILAQEGLEVHFLPLCNTPSTTLLSRAQTISAALRTYPSPPHLVAFSLAGVEARVAIGALNAPAKSLTTISSPINGCLLGDWANTHARTMTQLEPLLSFLGMPLPCFQEYSTPRLLALRSELGTLHVPEYSISSKCAEREMCGLVQFGWDVITSSTTAPDTTNDGVIAVKEARHGTHLTTFEMDHTELLGSNPHNNCALVYRLAADAARLAEGHHFSKVKA